MAQLADIVNIFCQTKKKTNSSSSNLTFIYKIFSRMWGGRGCWRGWVMGPLYLCFIVFADDHLARKFVYFTVCLWLLLVGWYKDNRLNKPRQSEVNIWRENVVSSDQFQILNFFVNPNPFESGMGHTTGLHCPVLNYVWYNPWVGDQLCQDIGAYGGERKNR